LPISFAQNLFYAALSRVPEQRAKSTIPYSYLLCLVGSYCACLVLAPYAAGCSWLINVIVAARLLLFSPLLIAESVTVNEPITKTSWDQMLTGKQAQRVVAVAAAACTTYQSLPLLSGRMSMKSLADALYSHPAVSALGCDFVLCLVSYCIWTLRN
jgi:hypothetical protein